MQYLKQFFLKISLHRIFNLQRQATDIRRNERLNQTVAINLAVVAKK